MDKITIQLASPMIYDKLHTLAVEYSVTIDFLINLAAKRLLDDVEFIRNLREGKAKLD